MRMSASGGSFEHKRGSKSPHLPLHFFPLLHPGPLCPKSEVVSGLDGRRKPSSLGLNPAPLQVDIIQSFQAQLRWESQASSPDTTAEPAQETLLPLKIQSLQCPFTVNSSEILSWKTWCATQGYSFLPCREQFSLSQNLFKALRPSRKAPTALCKVFLLIFGQDKGMHYHIATSASSKDIQIALSHPKQMPQKHRQKPPCWPSWLLEYQLSASVDSSTWHMCAALLCPAG